MKLQIQGDKLKSAIINCERITGKNLTLPVLSGILIVATGKSLKLRSTNLSLGVEFEVASLIEEEGAVLVKADVIANIMNNLIVDEKIDIYTENDNLIIKTKKNKLLIKCLPTEDFPSLPTVQNGNSFSISPKVFIDGIKSVYFCSAVSDVKPEISSVFVYTDDKTINFVATDSFRLAEKKIKLKNNIEINSLLIPFKNISEVLRVLEVFNDDIKISFNKNIISFYGGGVYLTSRLIDGFFPDYRQIIPKSFNTECILLKQDLLNNLRLSNIFTDKFQQINLSINTKEKKLIINSKNSDIGENNSNIDAVIKGDAIDVTVNLKYILDSFQGLTGDSVCIELTQPNKPLLMKAVSDNSFVYLLMPLNR